MIKIHVGYKQVNFLEVDCISDNSHLFLNVIIFSLTVSVNYPILYRPNTRVICQLEGPNVWSFDGRKKTKVIKTGIHFLSLIVVIYNCIETWKQ